MIKLHPLFGNNYCNLNYFNNIYIFLNNCNSDKLLYNAIKNISTIGKSTVINKLQR
jgi:hypothetical protein